LDKELLPHKQSLELQKLGFNEPCFGAHGAWGFMSANDINSLSDKVTQEDLDNQGYNEEDAVCLAPTWRQAFKFFREKGYDIKIEKESANLYFGFYWTGVAWVYVGHGSYEEAELECINKLISIVKEQQNGTI
jgi:hypothetical protein